MKQVISKRFNAVVLCYLALDRFYAGFFGDINLIFVKIIVLIDFYDLERVLSLILRPTILAIFWNLAKYSPRNLQTTTQNWVSSLEINSESISIPGGGL